MRVLPSQIVAALVAIIPNPIRIESGFDRDSGLEKVAPLFSLYRKLPEEHFILLSPDERLALGLLDGEIEEFILRWRSTDERLARSFGTTKLKAERLKVFANLLGKARDDAVAVPHATLGFMRASDLDLADALLLDISTAHSALGNGEFKAASVMAGSVAEALLLWAVLRVEAKTAGTLASIVASVVPKPNNDPLRWGLDDPIRVGEKVMLGGAPLVTPDLVKALDSARKFRNLIHPGAALRLEVRPTLGGAHLAVGAMRRTVESLEALVTGGKL